jgi:Na+/H+ antiporter NhaD/arsenite permease-like protein
MISLELISLLALLSVIILGSFRTDLNIGVLSIALAYTIGFYFAGLNLAEISSYFPSELFLMLVGITLLIYISRVNKTLDKLAGISLVISKGHPVVLPFFFFTATFILSAIGAGNIAATALIAPFAMGIAAKTNVNVLLMIIMICTGANAGTFSPIASTGIINLGLINKIGVTDTSLPGTIFLWTAVLQSTSAILAYFVFKGYKFPRKDKDHKRTFGSRFQKLNTKQTITLVSVTMLFIAVVFFQVPVGLGAFILSSFLFIFKAADQKTVLKSLPWSIILLVSGIMVLIGLIERTGGMDLATTIMADYTSPKFLYSTLSLVSSLVSIYSSSSSVVMPTLISLLPGLLLKLGSGELIKMIIAVDVGSHMVDVSPLSTLGALCLAAASEVENKAKLFRGLLIWGFLMAAFGALIIYIFLDLL